MSYHNHLLTLVHTVEGFSFDKWMELRYRAQTNRYDIIVLTDVLSANVKPTEFLTAYQIPGYHLITNDLFSSDCKHGVCMYVREQLKCRKISKGSLTAYEESLWVIIDEKILLCGVHRDDSKRTLQVDDQQLEMALTESVQLVNITPIIVGNLGKFDIDRDEELLKKLRELKYQDNLKNHLTANYKGSVLFTVKSLESLPIPVRPLCSLGDATISAFQFHINHTPYRSILRKPQKHLSKETYEKISSYLKFDWNIELKNLTSSQAVRHIEEKVAEAVQKATEEEIDMLEVLPEWANVSIDRLSRLMKEKYCRWNKHGPGDEYVKIWRKFASTFQVSKERYEKSLKQSNAHEWITEYMPDDVNDYEKLDHVYGSNDTLFMGDFQISQAFCEHFCHEIKEAKKTDNHETDRKYDSHLETLKITETMVLNAIRNLNENQTFGHNHMTYLLLQNLSDILVCPLTLIFNTSLQAHDVPYSWKTTKIVPKLSRIDKYQLTSYTATYNTSILSAIFEHVINTYVTDYLITNDMINSCQYGFDTTSSQVSLLKSLHAWTTALAQGQPVDVVYLDMSKAFDTVDSQKLLLILLDRGINKQLVLWLANFFIGRTYFVEVNAHRYSCSSNSGVDPGTILSNLLLATYINDLPYAVDCQVHMNMIDIMLFSPLVISSEGACNSSIQNDLNKLETYTRSKEIDINILNSKVMHLGGDNNPNLNYSIERDEETLELESVSSYRHLGILIDSELSFEEHINYVTDKAMVSLTDMKKRFSILTKESFIPCYIRIREILEADSFIWSPSQTLLSDKLENVQRFATGLITGFHSLTYNEQLQSLRLPTLNFRRRRADLIQMYRLVHGNGSTQSMINYSANPTQHSKAIEVAASEIPQQHTFLFGRVCTDWNSLYEETVCAKRVEEFIALLDDEFQDDVMYEYEFKDIGNY